MSKFSSAKHEENLVTKPLPPTTSGDTLPIIHEWRAKRLCLSLSEYQSTWLEVVGGAHFYSEIFFISARFENFDKIGMRILAHNRKAKYDYEILEKFEAGIVLKGHEVKSVKLGHMSLKGAYVTIKGSEAFLINANIPPYQPKNVPSDYNPSRTRKLLLKRREIKNLIGKVVQRKLTLVPIRVYTKNDRFGKLTTSKIKLEFGIAKGRKKVDKRELIKKREAEREIRRKLKTRAA